MAGNFNQSANMTDVFNQPMTKMTDTLTQSMTNGTDHFNQSVTQKGTFPCIVLGMNTTIPWNNAENLISWQTEELLDRIHSRILIPILFILGAPSNVINMVVFYKQGIRERINVCLFSLALVDFLFLVFVFVGYAERLFTQFMSDERYGPVYRVLMNNNVLGLYGLGYGSMILSTIISIERCVCVLFPLRAQRCASAKTLSIVIVVSTLSVTVLRFVVTAQYQVTCFYEMRTQRLSMQTFVNAYHFKNKAMLSVLDGFFYGICLSLGCPVIVLVTTVITALRLQHTLRWRTQASTSASLSSKEIGVTKMLICLSLQFLVFSVPLILLRVSQLFPPYLSPDGQYYHTNVFPALSSLREACAYASSSLNFIVYCAAGSKYRATLKALVMKADSVNNKVSYATATTSNATSKFTGHSSQTQSSNFRLTNLD